MGSFIDMTGWKMWEHGVPESKLTVIRQAQDRIQSNGIHIKRWIVECNCEKHTIFEVDGRSIKSGNTTSCGCTRGYNKYDLTNEYGIGITSNSNEEFYFSLDKYDLFEVLCVMSTEVIETIKIADECQDKVVDSLGHRMLELYNEAEYRRMRSMAFVLAITGHTDPSKWRPIYDEFCKEYDKLNRKE